ncbi:putative ATPase/DNA-binding winged helix-turn-helix (wHTH) protein [Rhizobium sp. SG_E_25_P2]|uniref:ATP-binding protein n=1 Tax=Rhizobium sp. SG_E_25_P2 TaxID=2879942 RepID=UPI002475477B|nr:winged helix-turn-helix domain-containing protein [Rhizobium sp. SG_E_25_P2]MDH6265878.1 putative ATPase/DNA-binding winged helix-turn-helix (wHTH) protein [Rhizobium sp. SG_E_25_P2]
MTKLDRSDMLATTPFQLRSRERALLRNGEPVKIGARAMEILIALAEKPGELVSKNELLDRVWPNQQIEEAALRVHLSALRRLLGTDDQDRSLIVNENGRGYRLIADLIDQKPAPRSLEKQLQDFPRPLDVVIGRDDMITEIARLSSLRRLVTLCGPTGIGKTTIATAVALEISETRGLTPVFLDLAPLRDGDLIVDALTELLGGRASDVGGMDHALQLLARRDYLVVFDTCEHLIECVTETVEALLRAAPNLSVIAASREPLRAEGEWLFRIPVLEGPEASKDADIETVLNSPAARLFVERARAQDSSWRLAEGDVPTLINICRKIDGIPLAIEMAAAKLSSMSLVELDHRLDDVLSTLTTGRRTALPRHRMFQTAIDWSYDLLNTEEKRLFAALSVFENDFPIDEAWVVAGGMFASSIGFNDLMAALVAKSLLMADQHDGSTRYRLLQTIRAYASQKLQENCDAVAV